MSKINEIIIDIISKLDINKISDIQKGNLYEEMIDRKDSLKKDSYFIFQETNLPFQLKDREIKCFNKEEKKEDEKKIKVKKEEDPITIENRKNVEEILKILKTNVVLWSGKAEEDVKF